MDGLLLDSERIALETFYEACDHLQLGRRAEVFYRCIGTNHTRALEVIREGFEGQIDHEVFWSVWDVKYKASKAWESVPLMPGVTRLLEHLSTQGVPMAVATATRTSDAQQRLARAGLLQHFTAVVGGDQVSNGKPAPCIVLRGAEARGLEPARCRAREDSENGVRAATAAGMTVIQVPDLVQPSEDLLLLGHTVHASLEEVA